MNIRFFNFAIALVVFWALMRLDTAANRSVKSPSNVPLLGSSLLDRSVNANSRITMLSSAKIPSAVAPEYDNTVSTYPITQTKVMSSPLVSNVMNHKPTVVLSNFSNKHLNSPNKLHLKSDQYFEFKPQSKFKSRPQVQSQAQSQTQSQAQPQLLHRSQVQNQQPERTNQLITANSQSKLSTRTFQTGNMIKEKSEVEPSYRSIKIIRVTNKRNPVFKDNKKIQEVKRTVNTKQEKNLNVFKVGSDTGSNMGTTTRAMVEMGAGAATRTEAEAGAGIVKVGAETEVKTELKTDNETDNDICANLTFFLNTPLKSIMPGLVNSKLKEVGRFDFLHSVGDTHVNISSATSPSLAAMHFMNARLCINKFHLKAFVEIEIKDVIVHLRRPVAQGSLRRDNGECCGPRGCGICVKDPVISHRPKSHHALANSSIMQKEQNEKRTDTKGPQHLGVVVVEAHLDGIFSLGLSEVKPTKLHVKELRIKTDHPCFTYLAGVFEPLIEETINQQLAKNIN